MLSILTSQPRASLQPLLLLMQGDTADRLARRPRVGWPTLAPLLQLHPVHRPAPVTFTAVSAALGVACNAIVAGAAA